MRSPRILISTKDEELADKLKLDLLGAAYRVLESSGNSSTLRTVKAEVPDAIILTTGMKDADDGLRIAQQIRKSNRHVPLILITTNSSEALAIAALRSGINDYFKEPFSLSELNVALKRCLSSAESTCWDDPDGPLSIEEARLIGDSVLLHKIRAYVDRVADTDTTVLLTGETGTGKELVARLIHNKSQRHRKPFVCVNCAAIPEGLLESELFGYVKGAFTGAQFTQEGKLKAADAGTVFFDEIGDMGLYAQAKILRTLESRELYQLGARSSTRVNLRFIAATNQDLEQLTSQGKFRRDLFFRLNVARIVLPPLRKRKQDIPRLFDYYIRRLNRVFGQNVVGFEEDALRLLLRHDWPGNVRELKNLLEAIFVNRPAEKISLSDFPESFHLWSEQPKADISDEQERLLSALFSTNWNKSKAAERLHWSRMTIYRKMAKYQLTKGDKEELASPGGH
jgi:DNA-binding NtrC family response regulator